MLWTDAEVATLTKLWKDGLSGTQIAYRMGEGLTRNAVIGKVHRLGLGRNPSTPRSSIPRVRNRIVRLAPSAYRNPLPRPRTPTAFKTAVVFPPQTRPAAQVNIVRQIMAKMAKNTSIPPALRVSLLDLDEDMCRWSYGDPRSEDFHFCARKKVDGISFCEHHAVLVYQPSGRKR